jgi:hypothetical protein
MIALASILMTLFVIALGCIFRGYVLMTIWNWFIVTSIGLPVLTFVPAMGVGLVIAYLTHQKSESRNIDSIEEYWEKMGEDLVYMFIYSVLALIVGWVIQLFM